MSPWHVLVVDDDREMRHSLVDFLQAAGCAVTALPRARDALRELPKLKPDVILSDLRMPGMTGLDLLRELAPTEAPPVVLISAHGDIALAVEAMQAGAYSFVEKPYDPRRLLSILNHAAEQHRMRQSNARLRARLLQLSGIDRLLLGNNPAIVALRHEIADIADSPATVMIQGETGTGKDLVARALHDLGPLGAGAFVPVNSALLTPEEIPEVALSADGGTLFLDEIAACPNPVQAGLLRLIETKLLPSGRRLNLRIVAATNDETEAAVADGRLRRDLLYRLNAIELRLPPLRDRRDDLALLAAHFLQGAARAYETEAPDLTEEDLAALIAYDWPGNVRELRNLCERRVLQARRGGGSMVRALQADALQADLPATLREAVAALEREMIGKAIRAQGGRMDAVADALGVGRRTLNEKIVKLGLDKDALL